MATEHSDPDTYVWVPPFFKVVESDLDPEVVILTRPVNKGIAVA